MIHRRCILSQTDGQRKYTKTTAALVVLVISLAFSRFSYADLISVDLFSPGDGLITRDTRTSLDWLDLPQTAGWSLDQALSSSFVTDLGFQIATADQVDSLLESTGILPGVFSSAQTGEESILWNPFGVPPSNIQAKITYDAIADLLGTTYSSSPFGSQVVTAGGLFLGESGPGSVGLNDNASGGVLPSTTIKFNPVWNGVSFDGTDERYGVYLAVATVPIPAALPLMITALLGIAVITRRKIKRV